MRVIGSATLAVAAMFSSASVEAMSGYKWKYRPVVVMAEAETSAALAEQRRIVAANRAGFSERGIVVVWVVGDRVTAELGPGPGRDAAALRARFGGRQPFRAVLVGKDGGTKLTSSAPLPAATLFATIDAMPMRRDEMQRR